MSEATPESAVRDVVCPFCGLGCDDLTVAIHGRGRELSVRENGCAISEPAFAAHPEEPSPQVDGQEASLDRTLERAAGLLREARRPLVGGLGTDLAGIRAALGLADRLGAVVDHLHGEALMRNASVVQTSGWVTATLAEIRNRAELLILAGSDVSRRYPRFFERVFWPVESLFDPPAKRRRVVLIGPTRQAEALPQDERIDVIPCSPEQLGEVFAALRVLRAGRPLFAEQPGGVSKERLKALAERLSQVDYGIVAWDAAELPSSNGDLTVETITGLIAELNTQTRWAGLPLGGRNGAATFTQACTWQTGFPGRVDFAPGYPHHDPHHLNTSLFAVEEADAVLWVSAFDAGHTPPETKAPTVVLGRPGLAPTRTPEAFIPVGTPGLDHTGHTYRMDGVMALPLGQLRDSQLVSTAQALAGIEERL